jgi:hypothetical protein
MSTHAERIDEIGAVWKSRKIRLPHGALPRFESAKAQKREINRRFNTATARIKKTLEGGAGHLMDQQIRHFFNEFNVRLFEHGPHSMPSSFNVLEAFTRYEEELNFFRLLPERDHLFSFSDFVDFITSKDAPSDAFAGGYQLAEDVIYSYSLYDDPHDLTFSIAGSGEFAVAGVSMIRTGDEVAMMLLGGRVTELEAQDVSQDLEYTRVSPGHEGLRVHPGNVRRAEPVGEHADLWKTIALVRFDLKARAEMVHYVFLDIGDAFTGILDDPEALPASMRDGDHLLEDMRPHLKGHAVLFEICRATLQLPAYFAFKYTLVRDEPPARSSQEAPAPAKRSRRRPKGYAGRVIYKRVAALRVMGTSTRAVRRFTAPQFRVEVDGFWRQLGPGRFGRGAANEPVEGRTWVRGHLRWRDLPEKPIEVLVKSRLAIARATVEAEDLLRRVGLAPEGPAAAPNARHTSEGTRPEKAAQASREEVYRQRALLTPRLRWKILQRDDFRCLVCGADAAADKTVRLDVDHILPIARGGKTDPGNLRTLCSRCNNGKGDLLP